VNPDDVTKHYTDGSENYDEVTTRYVDKGGIRVFAAKGERGDVVEGGERIEQIEEKLKKNDQQRKALLCELKMIHRDTLRWSHEAYRLLKRYEECR
jgi:hypothetical protein